MAFERQVERGVQQRMARADEGCQGLALNSSVEVILTVLFTGADVRAPLARDRWEK